MSGGIADETLLVDFHAGAALPNELIYDGSAGQNNVTITDAGDSSPHQYAGSGIGVSRDLSSQIQFSRVQNLTAIGGNGYLLSSASETLQTPPVVAWDRFDNIESEQIDFIKADNEGAAYLAAAGLPGGPGFNPAGALDIGEQAHDGLPPHAHG